MMIEKNLQGVDFHIFSSISHVHRYKDIFVNTCVKESRSTDGWIGIYIKHIYIYLYITYKSIIYRSICWYLGTEGK